MIELFERLCNVEIYHIHIQTVHQIPQHPTVMLQELCEVSPSRVEAILDVSEQVILLKENNQSFSDTSFQDIADM